jgi:phosphoglycolate phosphatase
VSARVVLFDFDGTLVDPHDGLLDSFVHGLAAVGVTVDDKRGLEVLIGPPIRHGFATYLGLTEPSLSVAVEAFRDYLGTRGVLEYAPYDGIIDLLDDLVAADRVVGIVTSKALPFVELVIDHIGLETEFATISAASLDGSVAEKADLLERALRALLVDSTEAVMIGDREFDIIGARAHDVRSIGVLWGYGSRDELEEAGADVVVEDIAALRDVLLANPS